MCIRDRILCVVLWSGCDSGQAPPAQAPAVPKPEAQPADEQSGAGGGGDRQAAGASFVTLAKGNRSPVVRGACKKHGGFYLGSIGGAAAILALNSIKKVDVEEYPELGMEAVWRIEVKDFPAFIIIDDKGNEIDEVNTIRSWSLDHWASRVGQGTYLNWLVANAIIPSVDDDPSHEGIQKVDRTTVLELSELPTIGKQVQITLDNAAAALNPLGLPENSVSFDIRYIIHKKFTVKMIYLMLYADSKQTFCFLFINFSL